MKTVGPLFFLLLPALVSCGISMNLRIPKEPSFSQIQTQGEFSSVITQRENLTFRITDKLLKEAADAFTGEDNFDVHFHDPIPGLSRWADDEYEYRDRGWNQVKRVLRPKKAEIVSHNTEEQVLCVKEFEMTSGTSHIRMTEPAINSLRINWLTDHHFDISGDISYSVNNHPDTLTLNRPFNSDVDWSESVAINIDVEFPSNVTSGQVVVATLYVTKVTVVATIEYLAELSGDAACRIYKTEPVNQIALHNYDINSILPNKVKAYQLVRVSLYTKAKMVGTLKNTNQKLADVSVALSKFT